MDEQLRLELIDRAIQEANGLLNTFNALLRIARIESDSLQAEFTDVDLGQLLRDVADLYEPVAEQKRQTITIAGEASVCVKGDRDLLFQTLANLFDNAIKYSPESSDICATLTQNEMILCDSGPGIPEAEHEKVFQRFYRVDASRSTAGSGLGLSLVPSSARHRHHPVSVARSSLSASARRQGLERVLPPPRRRRPSAGGGGGGGVAGARGATLACVRRPRRPGSSAASGSCRLETSAAGAEPRRLLSDYLSELGGTAIEIDGVLGSRPSMACSIGARCLTAYRVRAGAELRVEYVDPDRTRAPVDDRVEEDHRRRACRSRAGLAREARSARTPAGPDTWCGLSRTLVGELDGAREGGLCFRQASLTAEHATERGTEPGLSIREALGGRARPRGRPGRGSAGAGLRKAK